MTPVEALCVVEIGWRTEEEQELYLEALDKVRSVARVAHMQHAVEREARRAANEVRMREYAAQLQALALRMMS